MNYESIYDKKLLMELSRVRRIDPDKKGSTQECSLSHFIRIDPDQLIFTERGADWVDTTVGWVLQRALAVTK